MKRCIEAVNGSNEYELHNSELKKQYLEHNIRMVERKMADVDSYVGSFGTGYPFYALGKHFQGDLPVIKEQLRYNNELITAIEASGQQIWAREECLGGMVVIRCRI